MTVRTLYVIAYDIGDPRRLARVRRFLTAYRVGGQKSVFECWLTAVELRAVLVGLGDLLDTEQDRVHVLQLDPRQKIQCFGLAHTFAGWFAVV